MGNYLKICKNQEEYDKLTTIYPVTHLIDDVELRYDDRLTVFYNVTNINGPTILLGGNPKEASPFDMNQIKSMEIDGLIIDRNVSAYTFSEIGIHIVKFELINKLLLTYNIFNNVPSLKGAIVKPYSITNIGNGAFCYCDGIKSIGTIDSGADIIISDSINRLSTSAFFKCTNLSSVSLVESITSIGNSCFSGCRNLTEITIPKNVVDIYDYAFENCAKLSFVVCKPIVPPKLYGTRTFYNTNNCPIYVPQESVNAYKAAQYWSSYSNRIFPIV